MARVPRIYEPAWEQLKANKSLAIAAHVTMHRTIIRMIGKEKYKDAAYKFQLAEENKTAHLEYTISGNKITFKLIEELTLDGL